MSNLLFLVEKEGHEAASSPQLLWRSGFAELLHLLCESKGGKRIYGIAVDDAHYFQGEFTADRANPGRGWISVRARSLDAVEIMQQLEAGQFYASTGVDLADVVTKRDRLEVHIAPREDFRYTTTFIGSGGRVLAVSSDNPAVYRLQGRERYVRAKVTDSRGEAAWVQPVFVITP